MKLTSKSQCCSFPGGCSSSSAKPFLRPWEERFLPCLSWHLSETMFYFTLHQCKEVLNILELKRSQNIKVLIRHFHILIWQVSAWFTSQLSIQNNCSPHFTGKQKSTQKKKYLQCTILWKIAFSQHDNQQCVFIGDRSRRDPCLDFRWAPKSWVLQRK